MSLLVFGYLIKYLYGNEYQCAYYEYTEHTFPKDFMIGWSMDNKV